MEPRLTMGLGLGQDRFGPELFTNGTFDSNTTGWTATNSSSLASVAGELVITNAGEAVGGASQGITTVIGIYYTTKIDINSTLTANQCRLRVGTTLGGGEIVDDGYDGSSDSMTTTFIATATTTYFTARLNLGITASANFDNFSTKEKY